ncbi:MAG: histidinol-phosphate transaminase [Candidatus Hydrogenedentes bacterium]|nr:histidinol-phosphate transaminase [Candidatus Hydrogenedentota bacterium]
MKYGREMLQGVEGYVPGEQPADPDVVKLNTNENPYPPSPKTLEALRALPADAARRYPDALSLELRSACAERYGYENADWIFAGNGMDELLAMVLRTFVDPGDTVLSVYPTYVIYETLAQLHGAQYKGVDLDDEFRLPETFFSESGRLCFFARPNPPSGTCVPRADVERFCESFDGLVVIDEAYVDFADDDCMDLPKRHKNAIVMRTFSKSFSLAGLRVGVAVARPEIIREFLKTKDSYNLNAFSQAAALAAMGDYAHMQASVAKVRATRGRLIQGLRELGLSVPDSQANFVLAQFANAEFAKGMFEGLRKKSIFVRYFEDRRLDDALRISVGTDDDIEKLLTAMKDPV